MSLAAFMRQKIPVAISIEKQFKIFFRFTLFKSDINELHAVRKSWNVKIFYIGEYSFCSSFTTLSHLGFFNSVLSSNLLWLCCASELFSFKNHTACMYIYINLLSEKIQESVLSIHLFLNSTSITIDHETKWI